MKIKESAENYLETIYVLKKSNGIVRSIDIAHALCFSKPSVSVAMKNFREEGYINVHENGDITLTPKGEKIAIRIYERHDLIAKALISIGVSEETAYADSCKIEHDISEETFEKIKKYFSEQK